MNRFKSARALGVVAVAAVGLAATPHRATSPGITFDVTMTTASQPARPNGAGEVSMSMHGTANAAGATRMEISEVHVPAGTPTPYAVGDYYITLEGHYVMVHPATKTYVDIGDQATAAFSNLPPEILAQMSITDVTGKTETIPGNDAVDGRPTQHYRMTVGYSMGMMGQTVPTTIVTDYWVAKLPVSFANPFAGGSKPTVAAGPMAELIKKQIEIAPNMGDGVAVKMQMSTSLSTMGQSMVSSMQSAISNVKQADVDAAKFAMPVGYTKATR